MGESATAVEDMKLHAVATIATRPDKQAQPRRAHEEWRDRPKHIAEDEQTAWVSEP